MSTSPKPAQIRRNDDGTLDEVVGVGQFHLEQMSPTHWWMQLGDVHVHLTTTRATISAHAERDE